MEHSGIKLYREVQIKQIVTLKHHFQINTLTNSQIEHIVTLDHFGHNFN